MGSATGPGIVIAQTYNGLPVVGIGKGAFENAGLTSVVIPGSVTDIGERAFYGCDGLDGITFFGAREDWVRITKGRQWDFGMERYRIFCLDGTILVLPGGETVFEEDTETGDGRETGSGTETEPHGDDDGFPWWIILLILLILLILAAGAGAYYYFFVLHREPEDDDDDEPTPPPAEETPAPLFTPTPITEEPAEEEFEDIEIMEAVSADVVDSLMTDKAAEHFLEKAEEMGGVGKMGIINLGQIGEVYAAGDEVDLTSLQDKGLISDSVGRLKVLASGTLDKPLCVKADAFSVQAIKMITLTGGHAVKLVGKKTK